MANDLQPQPASVTRHNSSRLTGMTVLGRALCCLDIGAVAKFGLHAVEPDKTLLPAALRRRSSLTTRMATTAAHHACHMAGVEAQNLPSIFASVGGEIQVTDELCRMLPDDKALLSPTQFHNSVHNTTAGYWTILHGCQAPSTALAALDDTFAIGLLEAYLQLQQLPGAILLVCYDELWPQYLAPPIGKTALACALVLSNTRPTGSGLTMSLPAIKTATGDWDNSLLELARAAPAAVAIPLLQALQHAQPKDNVPLNYQGARWFTHLTTV